MIGSKGLDGDVGQFVDGLSSSWHILSCHERFRDS